MGILIKLIDSILSDMMNCHNLYHHNAAKIYINYSLIYKMLDQEMHSKNMIIKAKNLDPKIVFE